MCIHTIIHNQGQPRRTKAKKKTQNLLFLISDMTPQAKKNLEPKRQHVAVHMWRRVIILLHYHWFEAKKALCQVNKRSTKSLKTCKSFAELFLIYYITEYKLKKPRFLSGEKESHGGLLRACFLLHRDWKLYQI